LVAKYVAAPERLAAFPSADRVKPKTPFSGGLRARWKDQAGRIYEWDYRHGTVEVYSPKGRHLGEFDPRSGVRTKPPRPKRTIEP
jgi:hypothetical protein